LSLAHRVLGAPGQDNLLRVDVNSGSAIARLQFDCGDRCLDALTPGAIKATEHLFFSHLHMDHVGGFDTFFRSNFDRAGRAVNVWGPPGTAAILHHRFRGFWWNIVNDVPGTWIVHDVHESHVAPVRFEAREAFAEAHPLEPRPHAGTIVRTETFSVEAIALPHHGVSLGYLVREAPRVVVDRLRLAASGLPSGPWLRALKAAAAEGEGARRAWIDVGGTRHDARALAASLLVASPRESIAYVTDFLLDERTFERLASWLAGVDTLVCEAQYHPDEAALAVRNHHATIDRVASLARAARVGTLVPFHFSERYDRAGWAAMLELARERFPATVGPPHWGLDPNSARQRTVEVPIEGGSVAGSTPRKRATTSASRR